MASSNALRGREQLDGVPTPCELAGACMQTAGEATSHFSQQAVRGLFMHAVTPSLLHACRGRTLRGCKQQGCELQGLARRARHLVRNSFQTNMELKAESGCSAWDMLACTVRQSGHV